MTRPVCSIPPLGQARLALRLSRRRAARPRAAADARPAAVGAQSGACAQPPALSARISFLPGAIACAAAVGVHSIQHPLPDGVQLGGRDEAA